MPKTTLPVFLALALAAATASAEIYKWVDSDGRIHYSDQPPPAQRQAEEVALPEAPSEQETRAAQERLERLTSEVEAARAQRAMSDEERRLAERMEAADQAGRAERCELARQSLAALEQGAPVYRLDESGERVFLEDAEREARLARTRADVTESCG